MITFLMAQPERQADRDHSLRRILSVPLPPDADAFMKRFGIEGIATGYGSTEVPACIVSTPDSRPIAGSCGRLRDGFEIRLVDDKDIEVPVGEVGEAIVRSDFPWMISPGYENAAEASAIAWRNGWFHTGDLLRCDADGSYFFVDRSTDSLRRRGENISSREVEIEVQGFPGVAEAACVPARSPGQIDDDVKVWVVAKPDSEVDPAELLRYCAQCMPHFMVPRYIEVVTDLPKTPTAKVQKFLLRDLGNSERTWDRETHGFKVTRNGLIEA
jgi:crotonobetaine/carnitine-CoA ligase